MPDIATTLCFVAAVAAAFQPHVVAPPRRSGTVLRLTAAEAVETLAASQAGTLANIRAALPELAGKPDQSWASGETVCSARASLEAFDAPGTPNVAWLSALKVDGALSSLTVYNGPLTDVPHLASRVLVDDQTMSIFLDWRPRAYGAYETVRPDGTYPGPDELGREAFVFSGARNTMETKFYTANLRALVDTLFTSLEGATPGPSLPQLPSLEQLTRGPLCVDVAAPLTEANLASVVQARQQAADAWLQWQLDPQHAHKPGAPINSQYVFDTKAKINMYGALLDVYSAKFGDDGVRLAAADSGPLDEAYVGGGS